MANPQYNLSPVVMNVLIEAMSEGKLHPYNLAAQVHNNMPIHYKDFSALFSKEERGMYTVTLCRNGQSVGSVACASPIEAKATVLNYLASSVQKEPVKQQAKRYGTV